MAQGMEQEYRKKSEKRIEETEDRYGSEYGTNPAIRTGRNRRLDRIRGAALVSMILYHGCWDMVYLLGFPWKWYQGTGAWLWQQSICWTFILLSGYCWSMSRHHLRRGLITFGAGVLVWAVTVAAIPSAAIRFGVLTLLGSAALLMILADQLLRKVNWKAGLAGSFMLFLMFRRASAGWLGLGLGGPLGGLELVRLPEALFQMGSLSTWLGFPPKGFFSTDYFPILPWWFLFCAGYFLRSRVKEGFTASNGGSTVAEAAVEKERIEAVSRLKCGLEWMGRHSLLVYLLHQPALYGAVVILDLILR